MTFEKKIKDLFSDFIDEKLEVQTLPAKVISVNKAQKTCKVSFLDDELANNDEVHLTAGIGVTEGLVIFPVVNSNVYVSIINNNAEWAYISLFTEVSEIYLRGFENGGLIKISELIERLNALETAFNSHLHNAAGSPTTTPLKADQTAYILELTQKSQIENTKVKHG